MKKVLFFLAAAALFAVSCNKEASNVRVSEGGPVKFSAELKYQYDTRATATAFQDGDRIGIFAGTPIAEYNVKGTVGTDGHAVVPETVINWQEGQTAATTFAAYFPYNAEKTPAANSATPMVIDWSVAPVQSDAATLDACDLRIAKHENVAVDSPVSFSFTHAFAKIAINAVCNISGSSIQQIEVLGTKREGSVDLVAQTVTLSGDASPIITYHPSADATYDAIILPQTVAPQIRVTITGGTTYTYTMDGAAFAFEAGKEYHCAIAVNPGQSQAHAVTFSVGSITDWTVGTNNGFTYTGNPSVAGGNVWSIIGTINNTNWNVDFPMTQTATGTEDFQGTWEYTIQNYAAGQVFKLRFAGSWDVHQAGYPGGDGSVGDQPVDFQLSGENGGNISLTNDYVGRNVKITFNGNTWKITLTPLS